MNLGEFANISALWAAYPNGAKPGDYATVGTIITYWDDITNMWGSKAETPPYSQYETQIEDIYAKLSALNSRISHEKGFFDTALEANEKILFRQLGDICYIKNPLSETGYYVATLQDGVFVETTTPSPSIGINLTKYQLATEPTLQTENKNIKGAINELLTLINSIPGAGEVINNLISVIGIVGGTATDTNVFSALRTLAEITTQVNVVQSGLDDKYLKKTVADTAQELITFANGIKSNAISLFDPGIEVGQYAHGLLGSGGALKMVNGNSELEVDKLTVRKLATFFEVLINKVSHIGGQLILSPASMICREVDDTNDPYNYICYIQDENGKVTNQFEIGDQARCQVFTGTGQKYYWRLVTSVATNAKGSYIKLSKTDFDNVSADYTANANNIPQAGDHIVQLGNRTNASRQNAQILSTVGSDAPSYKQYKGINSYVLTPAMERTKFTSQGNTVVGTLKVTNGGVDTDIKDYVDNIQVGGRNLLLNTANELWQADTVSPNWSVINTNGRRTKIGKLLVSNAQADNFLANRNVSNDPIKEGKLYTLSFLLRGTSIALDVSYAYARSQSVGVVTPTSITDFKKVTFTFTAPQESAPPLYPAQRITIGYSGYLTAGAWFEIAELKLEEGNKATDWTPAPEDTEAAIFATKLYVQYSSVDPPVSELDWHEPPMEADDIYFRQKLGNNPWGAAVKFVGANGTSISMKGSVATYDPDLLAITGMMIGDGRITRDTGKLWVYDGTDWVDAGVIKGTDALPLYLHTAYANSADGSVGFSTTDPVGKEYIGMYSDNMIADEKYDYSRYTWMKIKGEKGDSAPLLYLSASSQVMKCNRDGSAIAGQTITISAKTQNAPGTATYEAIPYINGAPQTAITLGGSGNARTLTSADWINPAWEKVVITATLTVGTITLTDVETVWRIMDGKPATNSASVSLYKRTETATVPARPTQIATYRFSDGLLTGIDNGWTKSLPSTGGAYRWVTMASVISEADTDTIDPSEWITPEILAEDGQNGNDAIVYELVSSSYVANKNAITGAYTPAVINLSGLKTIGNGTPAAFGGIYKIYRNGTLVYTSITSEILYNYTIPADTTSIKVELYLRDVKVDETTIAITNDGTGGLTCSLSNEAHSVPCDAAETPLSFTGSGTDIYVSENGNNLSYVTGTPAAGQFSVSASASGITCGAITAGTNPYRAVVGSHQGMTANPAQITYTITACNSKGVTTTLKKVQTLTKSITGEDGLDAIVYELVSSSYVANRNAITGAYTPAVINLSGLKTIGNGTPAAFGGIYKIYRNGTLVYTSITSEILYNYTIPADTTSIKVELYLGAVKVDETTIAITNDGTGGLTCSLSNEAHSVPCDAAETPLSFTGSGTDIYVSENGNNLSYVTGTPAAGQFSVSASASGITCGAITAGTNPYRAVVGSHQGMTANPAQITYTITACNSKGVTTTLKKVQTLTKSITGASGYNVANVIVYRRSATALTNADRPTAQSTYTFSTASITGLNNSWTLTIPSGTDPLYAISAPAVSKTDTDTIDTANWSTPVLYNKNGENPIVGQLTNEHIGLTADSNGVVANYTAASGTFLVIEGLIQVSSGIQFSVASSAYCAVTINSSGTYVVGSMQADKDYATATLQAIYKGITITKILTLSKSKQGIQGDPGAKPVVDVEYARSTSATIAPTTVGVNGTTVAWQTATPAWVNGQYIWSRVKTTYGAETPTYSNPACITGNKGLEIKNITEQYYLSSSDDGVYDGSWLYIMPTWQEGWYIWTRSMITWADNSTTYTDAEYSYIWQAFNNLEVGGVNLIKNGNFLARKNNWNTVLVRSMPALSGTHSGAASITVTSVNGIFQDFTSAGKQLTLYYNYTLTFKARRIWGSGLLTYGREKPGTTPTVTLTTGWQTYTQTFYNDEARNIVFYHDIGQFEIADVKLVRSDNAYYNYIRNGNFTDGRNEWINGALEQNATTIAQTAAGNLPAGVVSGGRITTKTEAYGLVQDFTTKRMENGKYMLSFMARSVSGNASLTARYRDYIGVFALTGSWVKCQKEIWVTDYGDIAFLLGGIGVFDITNIQLEKGNKVTAFKNGYLETAIEQDTFMNGGLILSSVIGARDNGVVRSYMNGLEENPTAFAAGVENFGTETETKKIDLRHDGAGQLAGGKINWDAAGAMNVGLFSIFGNLLSSGNISFTSDALENLASISGSTVNIASPGSTSAASYNSWQANLLSSQFTLTKNSLVKFRVTRSVTIAAPDYVECYINIYDSTNKLVSGYPVSGNFAASTSASYDQTFNLPAGTYYISVNFRMTGYISGNSTTVSITGYGGTGSNITINPISALTKIANNGFYSYWGASAYMYLRTDYGFEVRFGNYGIQVTTSGLKKMTDGVNWVTL